MREIKFRVYTEIRNEVLGMEYFSIKDKGSINNTIMQYTGLRDKNGKEIYEHDIIKFGLYCNGTNDNGEKVGKVERGETGDSDGYYYDGHFEFMVNVEDQDWSMPQSLHDIYKTCVVIGNIHENPGLI